MTRTAKTYGGALYDLAQEEHLEDAILADLAGVRAVLDENPDYLLLLCTPSVPKEERRGLLDEAWRPGAVRPAGHCLGGRTHSAGSRRQGTTPSHG